MTLDKSETTIKLMFNSIAQNYDLMNDLMTGMTHRYTRRFMCNLIAFHKKKNILDLATGTGDNIIYLKNKFPSIHIKGLDLSEDMLRIAFQRIKKKKLEKNVKLIEGDILSLPFESKTFDLCTISYGIRNVSNILLALKEINRVTKRGGSLIIVEATNPSNRIIRFFSHFYFQFIIPKLARIISPNFEAYNYLSDSIKAFPSYKKFKKMLEASKWSEIRVFSLLFGTVTVYQGIK
ncbi:MAG: bifunctional demethylmenaquinone methyltransferase/2-methoxy-6-polyprenyl-1,4-benzoquinol methylase UbiE [Candidatus Hodarchaeales archaeon]|jgi:demethylmenaquinone methyltransferase/2-methoxy-6-polyprenyl-1,4-benzoquinol methylase